jgi:hypothetical protein
MGKVPARERFEGKSRGSHGYHYHEVLCNARKRDVMTEILIPSIIKIGGGSFQEASATLVRLQCKRPLIVTDVFLAQRGLSERLRVQIEQAGIECCGSPK